MDVHIPFGNPNLSLSIFVLVRVLNFRVKEGVEYSIQ